MSTYLSSAYLAPIAYYATILHHNDVLIEQHENYVKQSYRNRCIILSANGSLVLSIPIESNGGKKCPIRDIRIAEHGNWRHLHWNAIVSAYNSTPFFEYYENDFRPFYEKKYKYLFDFNEGLRHLILDLLGIENRINYTTEYTTIVGSDSIDFRETISPKKDWKVQLPNFSAIPYYQVFQDRFGFTENLSIIDLLFNMGNESLLVLDKSIKKPSV